MAASFALAEGARSRVWMSEDDTHSAGESLRQAILDALRQIEVRLSTEAMSASDVHLARRAAKRARALARLAPPDLATLARHTRTTVDRTRRALGEARDADVRAATLEALKPKLGDAHEVLARLAQDEAPDGRRPVARQSLLEEIVALVRDWSLCETRDGLDDVIAAAGATYRRMRKRAKAARHGGGEALHRWRAAVTQFEYQADFLARFAPEMKDASRIADRLRKHLGDINDLDELCGFVSRRETEAVHRSAVHRLSKAGAAQRARLIERAYARADELLALKPAAWTKALRKSCGR